MSVWCVYASISALYYTAYVCLCAHIDMCILCIVYERVFIYQYMDVNGRGICTK